MTMIRFRLTGSRDDVDDIISALHGIEGIEHVEEVDDLVPLMRDDSSSNELVDDTEGNLYYVEVDADGDLLADAVRGLVEDRAAVLGVGVEIVDDF
ncbi:hypothetical protein QMK61_00285 [Fulvimonas sp. R45]|uniref:hypothetical protein n=1 Tax=Fulvimonas sp. R45 TaxID=3045937 RepID=UPI00265F7CF1|nr:hypothetical protein [Fulvimonas sp. R45]MDO1527258.1 hypothetical protein [Fulvimonas sp. R45]